MYLRTLLSISLLTVFSFTSAQTLKSWTWDYYKIKFNAPHNIVVRENTADKFEASSGNITMDIYPRVGERLTYDGMKNAIVKWANQTSLYYQGDQPIYLSDINRYWGCAIDGSKNGFPASALLLIDPDYPQISFYIWISYKKEYYHDAVAILKSFTPY